ncbi:aKG-HExxH-type peptide beta-hydroxylase [Streptomyces sp. NPDC093094]|uniref:aKG-HExxH-type peptide beta-hydroxylase n=1 Tax=Streptomyces sp. NPDC093094 TaxID=3366026 RepID=UPI0038180C2D
MTSVPFRADVIAALARTRPVPAAAEALRSAVHTRRLLLVKTLLVRVEEGDLLPRPEARRQFEKAWALLVAAERTDAAAVRDVLDYPMIGAWLTEMLAETDEAAAELHAAHLGGVAAVAAVRAGHLAEETLRVASGTLTLPGMGILRCPSGRVRLSGAAGQLRIADADGHGEAVLPRPETRTDGRPYGRHDASGWSALRVLPGSAVVLDDLDPYRAPPGGIGPAALPPAERSADSRAAWVRTWSLGRSLLVAADPDRAVEISQVLRAVVPLAPPVSDGRAPTGATRRAAPGAVLAQLPGAAWELAECLVHETHHSKLAVLQELVPLYRPGGRTLHTVGWRPDPRPVPAVLQGTYAHLALIDLWSRIRGRTAVPAAWRQRAAERFDQYREDVDRALSVLLESDELTCAGREFVCEMVKHHTALDAPTRQVM